MNSIVWTQERRKSHSIKIKSSLIRHTTELTKLNTNDILKVQDLRKQGYAYNKISLLTGRGHSFVYKHGKDVCAIK